MKAWYGNNRAQGEAECPIIFHISSLKTLLDQKYNHENYPICVARFRYHNHYHADVRVVTISGPAKTVSAAGVVVCSVRGPRHDAIVHGRYGTTTPSDEMAGDCAAMYLFMRRLGQWSCRAVRIASKTESFAAISDVVQDWSNWYLYFDNVIYTTTNFVNVRRQRLIIENR